MRIFAGGSWIGRCWSCCGSFSGEAGWERAGLELGGPSKNGGHLLGANCHNKIMKNIALVVLAIAALAFGTLYVKETGKRAKAAAAAEVAQRRAAELEAAAVAEETKRGELRAELEKSWNEAAAKDRQVAELKAAAEKAAGGAGVAAGAKPVGKGANPMAAIGKMFDDPAMKEAIAAQQKAALGPMLEKMYGKLFSDLGLSAEESGALKELLMKKHLAGAEMGMSMLTEGGGNAADLAQKVKAAGEAANAEIRAFLGEERFAQFQAYEKTTGDRMAVSGFRDSLGAGAALSGEQEQQLVAAMSQAREGFQFTRDFSDPTKFSGNMAGMFTEENVNRFMEEMDQLNQRYVAHAQNILTPNQLDAFQKHLSQQQALQRAGMQMGAKLFGQENQAQ